jgi:putative pyruvate formate lyase activating enzyme
MQPSFLTLFRSGELAARADRAWSGMRRCALCPRRCRVDRLAGELGCCRTGALARVASAGPHFGEEAPLVGRGGSGTIFFAGCNLSCVFCQNYDLSHLCRGREEEAGDVARTMLALQARGCENINFVSPSHVVPQILAALVLAGEGGLHLPLVYNSGGYDSLVALRLLDGVVDIYMPDMKYADEGVGLRLSGVPDYVRRNRAAAREMHRQVGNLEVDGRGVARRGLLVRHLVLPNGLAGTAQVARFIAGELSVDTYVNIMGQYRPEFEACSHAEISRPPSAVEYGSAVEDALEAGLRRLDDRRAPPRV